MRELAHWIHSKALDVATRHSLDMMRITCAIEKVQYDWSGGLLSNLGKRVNALCHFTASGFIQHVKR